MGDMCFRYGCSFPVGFVAPIPTASTVAPLTPLTEVRMKEMVEAAVKPKKKGKKKVK